MGFHCLSASAVCTGLSFVGLLWSSGLELTKIESDGILGDGGIHFGNAASVMELLLGSNVVVALLASFVFNLFVLVNLSFKTIFFADLYPSETRKVIENLVNFVIHKGIFLPLVIPHTYIQAVFWSSWLLIMCCLKMFQTLAKDRLERLNSSPSATSWAYFRVYSVLLVVLAVDISWIWSCLVFYWSLGFTSFLLLFFEPLSIGFETMQAIIVHGFQLLDIWLRHFMEKNDNCYRSLNFDRSTAGSLCDLKNTIIRNLGFLLELMSLLMVLGHNCQIWWLRGMAFHLVDAMLLLNMRALVSTIFKRAKGFVKLKLALNMLDEALPDATKDDLHLYNDDCTICREAMSKAKRLSCNHLFHLWCLRSWLDQGLNEVHACPTCRRPLFTTDTRNSNNTRTEEFLNNEHVAGQLLVDNSNNSVGLTPDLVSDQWQSSTEANVWRGLGLDPNWVQSLPNSGLDGAGSSTAIRFGGLGRVQMMMRNLASVGETYGHTGLEDSAWGLWPIGQASATSGSASTHQPSAADRFNSRNADALRFRNTRLSTNIDNLPGLLAMADAVREVLPHVPHELIIQDLQRTNNVTITVNNLLQI